MVNNNAKDRALNMENPLVSIIVVTYNSAEYVVETLESAKGQTYKNIELIVSDDCSTDNTVEICHNWVKENKVRFVRTEVITVDENSGVAPNCNRGIFSSKGKWMKLIAGDDILLNDCINLNLLHVKDSKDSFFFSTMRLSIENKEREEYYQKGFEIFNNEKNQLRSLLVQNYLPAPTAFFRREALIELGGYDENYPMFDDYPLWIKAVKNNYKIIYNDFESVIYRIHDDALSTNDSPSRTRFFFRNISFQKSKYLFRKEILLKEQLAHYLLIRAFNLAIEMLQFKVVILFNNKYNFLSAFIFNLLYLLKPSFYYKLLIRIIR
ncbi:glycosyltransferase [Bacteroidota bacterium]